jgi:ubiquinone/menaquinone biosynthesis C-methylase UbiE
MKSKVKKLFVATEKKVGNNWYFRTIIAIYLFDFLDRLRRDNFPSDWYKRLERELNDLVSSFEKMKKSFDFSQNNFSSWQKTDEPKEFAKKTGEVYYKLWKDFKKEEYFKQTVNTLKERLDKNNISVKGIGVVLDDGCGGGRYTMALKALGVKKITGIDISQNSVNLAQKMSPFKKSEVNFIQGSVLKLPFKNNSFDFVFSNGVLHHTESTEKGLSELYRVLKPGGQSWLYLYGGKGSLFWDIVDFCRQLVKDDVPQEYVQNVMKDLGYPSGRIFHRSDFFYVPAHRRYLTKEMESMLKKAGFKSWRRLTRGAAIDWDEMKHTNPKMDPYIYGEGEMRYLIQK